LNFGIEKYATASLAWGKLTICDDLEVYEGTVISAMNVYDPYKCDRILENHPYGHKWHSKYLALKSSIQHLVSTHTWLQWIINTSRV